MGSWYAGLGAHVVDIHQYPKKRNMKSKLSWMLTLAILSFGAASYVKAEPPTRESSEWRFKELDANGDKRLSEQEYTGEKLGKAKAKAKKQFKGLDRNGDESLSFREYAVK